MDNDSSIFLQFLHSLIEMIKQMGPAFTFSGSGKQLLKGLSTYLLETVDLVICLLLVFRKPVVYSKRPHPGWIEGSRRDWMSADPVPPRMLPFAFESQPPLENI